MQFFQDITYSFRDFHVWSASLGVLVLYKVVSLILSTVDCEYFISLRFALGVDRHVIWIPDVMSAMCYSGPVC